jgi:hypothetical protein
MARRRSLRKGENKRPKHHKKTYVGAFTWELVGVLYVDTDIMLAPQESEILSCIRVHYILPASLTRGWLKCNNVEGIRPDPKTPLGLWSDHDPIKWLLMDIDKHGEYPHQKPSFRRS